MIYFKVLSFLLGYLPISCCQIYFITHKYDNHLIGIHVVRYLLNPIFDVFKRLLIGAIKYHYYTLSPIIINRSNGLKSLLACSIPYLKFDFLFTINLLCLASDVNSYRCQVVLWEPIIHIACYHCCLSYIGISKKNTFELILILLPFFALFYFTFV